LGKISNIIQHRKPVKETQKPAEADKSAINYWLWQKHSPAAEHRELAGSLRRKR